MSEMSAEKKKEIEKYIIKSYFGGGKNVESLANGADVIKGTDDGYIPQLIVEITYFGESGVVMVKWNVYGDSQRNSFAMRVCREREIERNRCDSVDAMSYAWEAWKSKIQGKPIFLKTNDEDLQKDKRIEELEREIKALKADNEVMDRHIQELESHNVSLAETNAVLNNKLNTFDPLPNFRELLKKLYSTDDVEKLEWTINHICGGRGSVNGWIAVSSFWKRNYETLSKLVGFSSVEEIKDYLTNEAKCDTLHEAIDSTESWHQAYRDVKATNEKLADNVKSWRKATGYSTPEGFLSAMTKDSDNVWRDSTECKTLVDIINGLDQEIDKWQKATGYNSPEEAKTFIKNLNDRLGGFIQAASCAERHLEHVLLWKPEQTGQEVK